jgi:hypothetical protein
VLGLNWKALIALIAPCAAFCISRPDAALSIDQPAEQVVQLNSSQRTKVCVDDRSTDLSRLA